MNPALDQRSPVAKAGWLIGLFLVGWLAFLFVPWPRRTPPPDPLPKMVVKPPSRLQAVGLPDNPDLDGLSEFFAIQAGRADWEHDRALFAYWCPGTKDYSYFFAAIRDKDGIRFQEIPKPDEYAPEYYAKGSASDEFPIRLISQIHTAVPGELLNAPTIPEASRAKTGQRIVPIDLAAQPIKPESSSGHANENLKERLKK